MAVTDHAEYMGAIMQMTDSNSPLYDTDLAKRFRNIYPRVSKKAKKNMRFSVAINRPHKKLVQKEILPNTWDKMVQIANDHFEPGKFTTFPSYEWTSAVAV